MIISTPFGFVIDATFWSELFAQPTFNIVTDLFFIFCWPIIAILVFFAASYFWRDYRGDKFQKKWEWVLLAIDVPELTIQTPKAVEQIFAHLSGSLESYTIKEKFWQGKRQRWFSLEIISMEGYIQFLIWCEKGYRDLVESCIYAQYPESEITEVEDYTSMFPNKFPNEKYDMMGVEFKLAEANAYPIRTYPHFQYNITPDITFSDSMAALLESFTRIGRGENLWMQIAVIPADSSWKKEGIELVKELIAGKKKAPESILSRLSNIPKSLLQDAAKYGWRDENMLGSGEASEDKAKEPGLTPGGRTVVEAIEEKISKVAFKSKIRLLYLANKDVFNPAHCVGGVVGAMNQFNIQSSNAIVPYKNTVNDRRGRKRTRFYKSFQKRKLRVGLTPYILNIEELATVWHFPMPFVKAPLVQKISAKRGEPPSGLPIETDFKPLRPSAKVNIEDVPAPPTLPVEEEMVTDASGSRDDLNLG